MIYFIRITYVRNGFNDSPDSYICVCVVAILVVYPYSRFYENVTYRLIEIMIVVSGTLNVISKADGEFSRGLLTSRPAARAHLSGCARASIRPPPRAQAALLHLHSIVMSPNHQLVLPIQIKARPTLIHIQATTSTLLRTSKLSHKKTHQTSEDQ